MTKKKRNLENLTDKQKKFVEVMARGYHQGKDPTKITVEDGFRMAGYAPDTGNAFRLYRDLKDLIQERRDELIDHNQVATLATQIIEDIMIDPEVSPQIRLKAAQDILHRTGYDKPKEVNVKQTVSEMTDEELDQQLASLIETSDNVQQLKQGG
jgi:hypothetical protein